jgi:L-glutamine:2-deoxy-scyllo-inosose/3-amino-2,3-dideoxy-scyllo-inosose aminotransferase
MTRGAVGGGAPVRRGKPWPSWPEVAPGAERAVLGALHSGRWAISSSYNGSPLYERRFAEEFARYLGIDHCVPTDHGSSALVIALESLGLEHGAEVVVPTMTWVATATAVLRAGLVPVLADVDPDTGCLTPGTIERVLTADTAAILVVHWACVMADMPGIVALAADRGLAVVEDAAQAHGASIAGRRAGTFGTLGCFSMQHAKVLTCGEGGAVVTGDTGLAHRLQELRADSRRWVDRPVQGQLELRETASMMGANFGLDEVSAALLCAQLEILDEQHERRNRNYRLLGSLLAGVPGVRLLREHPRQDRLSLYEVPLLFDTGQDGDDIARALTAELQVRAYRPRTPLYRSSLLRPWTKTSLGSLATRFAERNDDKSFPGAESLAEAAVVFHHSAFLGDEQDMRDIATAVRKVTWGGAR